MSILFLSFLRDPTHNLFLLDYRLPLLRVPLKLCGLLISYARRPTNKDNTRLITLLDLNKAKNKDISITTDEALDG